jgi:hypothetical protein
MSPWNDSVSIYIIIGNKYPIPRTCVFTLIRSSHVWNKFTSDYITNIVKQLCSILTHNFIMADIRRTISCINEIVSHDNSAGVRNDTKHL